jgi:hypothetical protein
LYVRAFPSSPTSPGGQLLIAKGVGRAVWSRTKPELLYQAGDQIMAVSYVVNGDSFKAENPRIWARMVGGTIFDLALDSTRVAVLTPVGVLDAAHAEHEVVFLLNWLDELKRRVPTK